jgi:hypothetical protein
MIMNNGENYVQRISQLYSLAHITGMIKNRMTMGRADLLGEI